MSDIRIVCQSVMIPVMTVVIQASLVLALLFSGPGAPAVAQTISPPAPLIRDARFDSKPVNIGTQLQHARPFDMVRQTDGKRILVGTSCTKEESYPENARCPNIVLTRYDVAGQPDLTFGKSGIAQFDDLAVTRPQFYANQQAGSVVLIHLGLQRSGKTIVGWRTVLDPHLALARFGTDGNPDTTFGIGGILTLTHMTEPTSLAVQLDDRILVGSISNVGFQLNRLNEDGTPDTGFGLNGVVTSSSLSPANEILVQADAKIVTVNSDRLARFLPSGAPDLAFGTQGITDKLCASPCSYFSSVKVSQWGETLFVMGGLYFEDGQGGGQYQGVGLRHITADGRIDPSFGNNGWFEAKISGAGIGLTSFHILPDQRIVIFVPSEYAYVPYVGRVSSIVAARYWPTGNLDVSFGNNGIVNQTFGDAQSNVVATSLEPDGNLTLIGIAGPSDNQSSAFIVAQLTANGAFNPAYGNQGLARTAFTRGSNEVLTGKLLILPDHSVIAMAANTDSELVDTRRYHLIRYNPDGHLDESFGRGGVITMTIGGYYFQAHDMALQTNGTIVVAGRSAKTAALVRYLPNGTLDPTFGSSGIVTVTGVAEYSYFTDLTIQADGRLLSRSGFEFYGGQTTTSAVMRFLPTGAPDASFGIQGRVNSATQIDAMQVLPDQTIIFANQRYGYSDLALTAVD